MWCAWTIISQVFWLSSFFLSTPQTIHNNRKCLPQHLKIPKVVTPLGKLRMHKDCVQAIAWFDNRKVLLILSVHANDNNSVLRHASASTTQQYPRPMTIKDYCSYFSGVDKSDQLHSYYDRSVKAVKWWECFVWFYIYVSFNSAYIIYCTSPGSPCQRSQSSKLL